MTKADELLQELEQEAQTTRRVLERVPEDRLDWRPHEKSMTLGQLAWHVASLPGAIAQLAVQPTFDIKTPIPRPGTTSSSELIAVFERSLATAREILAGM